MADSDKCSGLLRSIKNKTKKIISDHKDSNLILDLLRYTQSGEDAVVSASCKATGKVFCHFISTGHLSDTRKTAVAEKDTSNEDQFCTWLKEQLVLACDMLNDHLINPAGPVAECALKVLASLLKAQGMQEVPGLGTKLIEGILIQLLSSEVNQSVLIEHLSVVLEAWGDEGNQICSLCLTHLKNMLKEVEEPTTDKYLSNFWKIIKKISSYDLKEKSRRQMTAVVCNFLKLQMPTRLYREILVGISSIMEKMSTPLMLTDFLSESFNIGGAISLMSLQGLFILMTQYNLDYPDFYTKLYSMFEPQVLSARYRARFFHLADIFLTSTHLPSYLVAAFAKRLAQLSLHAPASALYTSLPFIMNLISRHPACEVLLHRTENPLEFDHDPFLPNEPDPKNSKALESCLWELQTLERHIDPNIAERSKKRKIAETNLSELLETTTTDIMESEAKKIKKDIPINFERMAELKMPLGFKL
ncbi:nucleolar complex protein 4 homolog [Plakobranchus ocellatus]|uniref:Nucleolar complex protein 4 homolog n=1 Tax=Plakobranchus ocellatus TaxID=259542 RepID=A0AAV3ZI18_9GAST|nr:nucleolar complex protein 4 homolog [Plakobranchus ocellatus]